MAPESFPGQMPSSFDNNKEFNQERALQKVFRKLKEEPLVPIGTVLTVAAFVNAYRAIRRGDSAQANRMFRARVAAQGFTIFAMVAGSLYYSKDREKTAELRRLQEQREAEETRDRWIRELEVRDEEEKAMRRRIRERREQRDASTGGAVMEAVRENEQRRRADKDGEDEQDAADAGQEKGGLLGKMGLWSAGEKKQEGAAAAKEHLTEAEAAAETVVEEELDAKKKKKSNPNSSLGALGEIMGKGGKDPKDPKA